MDEFGVVWGALNRFFNGDARLLKLNLCSLSISIYRGTIGLLYRPFSTIDWIIVPQTRRCFPLGLQTQVKINGNATEYDNAK